MSITITIRSRSSGLVNSMAMTSDDCYVAKSLWMKMEPGMVIHYNGIPHMVLDVSLNFLDSGDIEKDVLLEKLTPEEVENIERQRMMIMQALHQQAHGHQPKPQIVTATQVPPQDNLQEMQKKIAEIDRNMRR